MLGGNSESRQLIFPDTPSTTVATFHLIHLCSIHHPHTVTSEQTLLLAPSRFVLVAPGSTPARTTPYTPTQPASRNRESRTPQLPTRRHDPDSSNSQLLSTCHHPYHPQTCTLCMSPTDRTASSIHRRPARAPSCQTSRPGVHRPLSKRRWWR